MNRIDLNADLGESFGVYPLGDDTALMPLVTSANIACGFHAGDPSMMARTVALAVSHGVALGAHPGLPDLVGFGRREMAVSASEVGDLVMYQIGALAAFAVRHGQRLQHVKPHGALYALAERDSAVAEAIAQAVCDVDRGLILVGQSGGQLAAIGQALGLRVAHEVFADRTYQSDGTLTPHSRPNAMLHDSVEIAARMMRLVRAGTVTVLDGTELTRTADTICLHGDSPHAAAVAAAVRKSLEAAGVAIRRLDGK